MKPQCYNNNRYNNTEKWSRISLRSEQNINMVHTSRNMWDYCYNYYVYRNNTTI